MDLNRELYEANCSTAGMLSGRSSFSPRDSSIVVTEHILRSAAASYVISCCPAVFESLYLTDHFNEIPSPNIPVRSTKWDASFMFAHPLRQSVILLSLLHLARNQQCY